MDIFKMTSTNLFIRPLFKIPVKVLDLFRFENAYIKDEIKGIDYPRAIYMLFHPKNTEKFNEFVEKERTKGFLIDEYDYPDNWIMLVFRYDEKWENDIALIREGRFSEVSYDYKEEIPKKAADDTIVSIQFHVFMKTDFVKALWYDKYGLEFEDKDELWHHYPEREIFNEENFKKIKG